MESVCRIEDGKLIFRNEIIERPAILVDSIGTVHSIGECSNVQQVFNRFVNGYIKAGLESFAEDLMLVRLDTVTEEQLQSTQVLLNWVAQTSALGKLLIDVLLDKDKRKQQVIKLKNIGY